LSYFFNYFVVTYILEEERIKPFPKIYGNLGLSWQNILVNEDIFVEIFGNGLLRLKLLPIDFRHSNSSIILIKIGQSITNSNNFNSTMQALLQMMQDFGCSFTSQHPDTVFNNSIRMGARRFAVTHRIAPEKFRALHLIS
jgi:hypothetical protein